MPSRRNPAADARRGITTPSTSRSPLFRPSQHGSRSRPSRPTSAHWLLPGALMCVTWSPICHSTRSERHMTQLSHVVSSRVMWLSMRARSPSARSPSTRRCASTPLGPIGPRSRAERCPPPTTPTVLAFSNRRPWSAAVGGTFCPVSSQGFGRIDAQSDRCRSRGRAYGPERLGGTVRPRVIPVIDSFRVHASSPQASLAYPSGPVRGTGRSESQRRRADTRGCTLDSAAHVKPEHADGAARPWLSVEQPTVHTDRPGGRTPSAICPWTPRHSAPQRDKVTHHGTEKKRPA
jgi:hypothetical protein